MIFSTTTAEILPEILAGDSPGVYARICQSISDRIPAGIALDMPTELFQEFLRKLLQGFYLESYQ